METVVGISRAWKMGETHTPLPSCPGCVLRGALEVKAVGEPRITLIKKTPTTCSNQHNSDGGLGETANYFHLPQPQSGDISSPQRTPLSARKRWQKRCPLMAR